MMFTSGDNAITMFFDDDTCCAAVMRQDDLPEAPVNDYRLRTTIAKNALTNANAKPMQPAAPANHYSPPHHTSTQSNTADRTNQRVPTEACPEPCIESKAGGQPIIPGETSPPLNQPYLCATPLNDLLLPLRPENKAPEFAHEVHPCWKLWLSNSLAASKTAMPVAAPLPPSLSISHGNSLAILTTRMTTRTLKKMLQLATRT